MIRFVLIGVFFVITICFAGAKQVNPDSLEEALSADTSDTAICIRAQLAYSRGLYQTAKDMIERKKNQNQYDLLLIGQCCHILAQSLSARAFFSRIIDPELKPLAVLGLGELYCGDLPDADSCGYYKNIVEKMDYLKRFVSLDFARSENEISNSATETSVSASAWTLQFGVFSMKSLAEKLSEKVKKEGIESWIYEQNSDGTILYFVYGGTFATKGEAAARADALAKEFTCKVVEYRR